MAVLQNLDRVLDRIHDAARRAGRDPARIQLVAVTKYAAPGDVLELARSGRIRRIGESRVQDAARKRADWGGLSLEWRMIGHLQGNKVKQAVEVFDAVDSVDSIRLAERLDQQLSGSGRRLPVLVQVKLTEKETQHGVAPSEVEGFLREAGRLPGLEVRGLMAIAPMGGAAEESRPHFRGMRRLFERLFPGGGVLSMGMSGDLEVAVEEGATMVRVGSALFS